MYKNNTPEVKGGTLDIVGVDTFCVNMVGVNRGSIAVVCVGVGSWHILSAQ